MLIGSRGRNSSNWGDLAAFCSCLHVPFSSEGKSGPRDTCQTGNCSPTYTSIRRFKHWTGKKNCIDFPTLFGPTEKALKSGHCFWDIYLLSGPLIVSRRTSLWDIYIFHHFQNDMKKHVQTSVFFRHIEKISLPPLNIECWLKDSEAAFWIII